MYDEEQDKGIQLHYMHVLAIYQNGRKQYVYVLENKCSLVNRKRNCAHSSVSS